VLTIEFSAGRRCPREALVSETEQDFQNALRILTIAEFSIGIAVRNHFTLAFIKRMHQCSWFIWLRRRCPSSKKRMAKASSHAFSEYVTQYCRRSPPSFLKT
jgi:hypothetical protein